jgi:hypothetical protein
MEETHENIKKKYDTRTIGFFIGNLNGPIYNIPQFLKV